MPPSSNLAQISLGLNNSALASGLRTSFSMLQSFAAGVGAKMSSLAFSPKQSKGQSWATHAGGQIAGTLAMRGIDLLVDQGRNVLDFENKLVRFGIAAKQTPMQLMAIRNAARATAVETGIDAGKVLDSARAYADLAGAANSSVAKMNLLSRAGAASEATGSDLAGMMYQLTRSMKVTDGQMEDTMGGLINQAKDGAIEARQMAAEFSGMMPIFARFGVVGREGAIQLGAMYQVTRDGFDSASQAATGMIRLMAGFQRHASRFEKFGVHVFKPGSKKDLRELSDIMEQVKKSPLSKDIESLIKAFGRSEAWRTFELLAEAPDRLKALEQAGRETGVINKDLATYTESAAGRMAIAFEKMKNAVAEAFTPERIQAFVGAIEGLATKVEPLVSMVGKLGDGVNAIYNAGKSVRKFMSSDSKLAGTSIEDVRKYREAHPGTSDMEAVKVLNADWGMAKRLQADVDKLMPNDKTTPESDKRVVQSAMRAASGSEELNAAMSYIYESGMTPKHQTEIENQIRKEMIDDDIAKGKGNSRAEVPQIAELRQLIDQHLVPALARSFKEAAQTPDPHLVLALTRSIKEAQTPALHLDGNKVNQSTNNATDRRRR